MNNTKKVAFNTFVQMFGKLVNTIIAISTVAVLFGHLGIVGTGEYTTTFAFVGFFSVLADFGLQWTLVRELSVKDDHQKVFSNVLALRLILAFLIHAAAFGAVWFFDYSQNIKLAVGVVSAAWFFTTVNTVLVGVYLRNYRLDISVTAETVGRAIILGLIIIFAKMNFSFPVILSAYFFGNLINLIINAVLLRRLVKLKLGFDFSYWKNVIAQAIPIGVVLIFGLIYFKIDSLMLSWMKGMKDVGIYGTSYKMLEVLETIPTMFLGAAFPLITQYAVKESDKIKNAFQKQFEFLSLISWPILVGTFVLARPIIGFIGGTKGDEFVGAYTVSIFGAPATATTCLRILIFVVWLNFFTCLYNYFVVSAGKQSKMIYPTIIFAATNIVLNLLLIPKYSYIGASVATLVTELIVLAVYTRFANSLVNLPLKLKNFFVMGLCAAIMGLAVYFLQEMGVNLFVNITVAALCYAFLVLVTRSVDLDTIRQILQRSK